MNTVIGAGELNNLKAEFRAYLRETNPDRKEITVSTIVSDAFFALNNDVGIDFWSSFRDETSMLAARDKISHYLAVVNGSPHSDARADGYLSAMRRLKAFLDAHYPTLHSDWKGKPISNVNLKDEFRLWMRKQKKSNGESYSNSTINSYASQLKNATARLNLHTAVCSDLFFYTSYDEFEAAKREILAAPNYEEIDAASNKSYSNGMVQYARFLKESGEPSAWIFQGNPKYYDVIGAVEAYDRITWATNQYPKKIKKDDKAYIWISGSDGGIVAAGTILCDPEMKQPVPDRYILDDSLESEPYLGVDIRLERKFPAERVPRAALLADERTKRLEILTYPGATNFRVTKAQEEVIESWIEGRYERVPAVDEPKTEFIGKRRYWLYSPGEQARLWDVFSKDGIMGIGWDELGDLSQYNTKEDIKAVMKEEYGYDKSYKNDGHALWQFANEAAVGDIVFAKRGMGTIIGRGVVQSDYFYDETRDEYKHLRKVDWTQIGQWEHPGQAAVKTLTDITPYTEYVEKLEMLVLGLSDLPDTDDQPEIQYSEYSESDFLSDVYISEEKYAVLKGLLLRKKNLILQGAPGVGKTFAAQLLAFSIMGEKDINRVKTIQFHQSYSYEDFVMGYRPNENGGFVRSEGPFYKFCKMAESDDERPYFFIIDEINRGNLSKIFGELLMLIESDKRGRTNTLRLLYKDEQFYVPKNIHIIGMMNTADRSLAMMDYALRRRFAFFDMEPAFQSEGFKARQTAIQNHSFDALISTVEALNRAIGEDASLGLGFRIGHSYFCTNDVVNDDWLTAVVEYELVPLLQEYWFDEPSKVESWSVRLRGALNG